MKRLRLILTIAAMTLCISWQARAADVKVIANSSVSASIGFCRRP